LDCCQRNYYEVTRKMGKDLPRGSAVWWFDQTDMANAKKVLGDTICIAGNIPASILRTGTPQDVKEACRQLIEVCCPGRRVYTNRGGGPG